MSVSNRTVRILTESLCDKVAAGEVVANLGTGHASGGAIAAIAVTATSGSLPTAAGTTVIAVAGTPTVVELLQYCTELNAKVNALRAALTAFGVTA